MMNEKLEKAFNDQINAEFYSEYLYLSMLAYFERLNLQGFKNWMDVQRQEEHAHAMGLFNYVHERGSKVTLQPIAQPETDWESPLAVFEAVLKHEQLVTSKINAVNEEIEMYNSTYFEKLKKIRKNDYWINHYKRNKKIKKLTREVLLELVESISVCENGNIIMTRKFIE